MNGLILGIDQGTTGTKVVVMDTHLEVVAEHYETFEQHFPKPGWVEHDLNQIWETVTKGLKTISKKIDTKCIVAIGMTNQRETVGFWNKKDGNPISRALVWQDRRTADRCEELRKKGLESEIQNKTGLLLDPYFSGTKIEWMLKNDSNVSRAAEHDELLLGTIDTFLLYKLTNGVSHVTEPSNASRTLLFNIEKREWDEELLRTFSIKRTMLPKVLPTFSHFGVTQGLSDLPDGIPITGMIGDQQSALLGQLCVREGEAKCTYGTGAFLLTNTGQKKVKSNHRLLTTIAWQEEDGKTTYALEGSAFMAGATIQWLRDGLKIIQKSSEVEALARSVPSSEGVVFVPAFTGMGAPHWDPHARAQISGLTRGTTTGHIARAALEGIAFQNVEILLAMEADLGAALKGLSVDGGACQNDLLMQIQADLLGRDLRRPKYTETTALGAIIAAGIGAKVYASPAQVEKVWKLDREFKSEMDSLARAEKLKHWADAVKRTLSKA